LTHDKAHRAGLLHNLQRGFPFRTSYAPHPSGLGPGGVGVVGTLCALLAALPFAALAQQEAALQTITIKASKAAVEPVGASNLDASTLQSGRTASSDTANLLRSVPGVSLFGAGGVSSLPSVHGLADDRLRIQVDGMDLVSACGNHMNPPLSYIDPTRVGSVRLCSLALPRSAWAVTALAPPSRSTRPRPNSPLAGEGRRVQGQAGAFYRSNGDGMGLNLSATYATEQMSLRYDGSTAEADNYKAGATSRPRALPPATSHAVAGGRRGGIVELQDPQPFAGVCLSQ
jgi:iron complex outermembrane receptor protein